MKKIFSLLLAFFATSQAFAYITATMGVKTAIDTNARTHIIIVGNGSDLGYALAEASAAKARKYREVYPGDQVVLLSANQSDKSDKDIAFLTEKTYSNITVKSSSFKDTDVEKEMGAFTKIASVDIFSHSVAYYGVILEGTLHRLDPKDDGMKKLAGHFTSDAFAFLHGCNGGQFLAPVLSNQWGIPVAGSFTGTDFQYLRADGQYYHGDLGKPGEPGFMRRTPEGMPKAVVNKVSYAKNIGCYQGVCTRMFPDNWAYHGFWGEFNEGGLGFYKWFCENNSDADCFKTMARAALTFVSVKDLTENSSIEDYKDVVVDYLCPETNRAACRAGLENALVTGNMQYDPFQAKSLQCDFKGCKASFSCQKGLFSWLKPGSCVVNNFRTTDKTTTMADEYAAYLKGYKLLQDSLAK